MTPKEKAVELVNKFERYSFEYEVNDCEQNTSKWNAKQCALIAVDEIVVVGVMNFNDMQYWQQVKTEIEKL